MEPIPLRGEFEQLDHRVARIRELLEQEVLSPELRAYLTSTLTALEWRIAELKGVHVARPLKLAA